jgi:pimeloyl-ACP methyl ester carboxylesterase
MRDQLLRLADGRDLAFTDMGEVGWPAVLFFHGAPTSRLLLSYLEPQFIAYGVRAISPDRPGYGKSSPQPGRSLSAWPHDVRALVDALELHTFVVAGHSSGGPYAVAAAALLPDRVRAATLFGGVTDMGWSGAWDGYSQMEAWIMRMPDEKTAIQSCAHRFGADGSGFNAASDLELAAPDRALYDNEIRELTPCYWRETRGSDRCQIRDKL